MISLTRTEEPTDAVRLAQPRVQVKWESHACGFGTLYVCDRFVLFASRSWWRP